MLPLQAKEGIEAQMEIKSKKDATDENTALDVLSGHFSAPQPVISELQCHTQLASAPVELASVVRAYSDTTVSNFPNQL